MGIGEFGRQSGGKQRFARQLAAHLLWVNFKY